MTETDDGLMVGAQVAIGAMIYQIHLVPPLVIGRREARTKVKTHKDLVAISPMKKGNSFFGALRARPGHTNSNCECERERDCECERDYECECERDCERKCTISTRVSASVSLSVTKSARGSVSASARGSAMSTNESVNARGSGCECKCEGDCA